MHMVESAEQFAVILTKISFGYSKIIVTRLFFLNEIFCNLIILQHKQK